MHDGNSTHMLVPCVPLAPWLPPAVQLCAVGTWQLVLHCLLPVCCHGWAAGAHPNLCPSPPAPAWFAVVDALADEEPEPQPDPGFPATFWVLAVAGGVNSFAAVVLAVVVNRLAVAVQASAEAAACASETAVSLVELSTAQALKSISALATGDLSQADSIRLRKKLVD